LTAQEARKMEIANDIEDKTKLKNEEYLDTLKEENVASLKRIGLDFEVNNTKNMNSSIKIGNEASLIE
jgi:hypothetical protein